MEAKNNPTQLTSQKSLKKLSTKETEDLKTSILKRIAVIKQCKTSLISQTKALIREIENLSQQSLNDLEKYIKTWHDLLNKHEYTNQDLSIIRKLNSLNLVANEKREIFLLDEINELYNKQFYSIKPNYSEAYDKKWENFLKHCGKKINRVLWAKDKGLIVTGGVDGVIRFWDRKGEVCSVFCFGQKKITALCLSSDGRLVVSGSITGNVSSCSTTDTSATYSHSFHKKKVASVSVSSNNQFIISGDKENVIVCDLFSRTAKFFFDVNGKLPNIRKIDGQDYFLIKSSSKLKVFNFRFEAVFQIGLKKDFEESPAKFSQSGQFVAVKDLNERVYVYKLRLTGKNEVRKEFNEYFSVNAKDSYVVGRLRNKENFGIEKLWISQDFKYFAFQVGKVVRIWSTGDGKVIADRILKKYQTVVALCYEVLYVDGDEKYKGKVFGWNFLSNTFKQKGELLDETIEIFSLHTSSNKQKVVMSTICSLEIFENTTFSHLQTKSQKGFDSNTYALITKKDQIILIKRDKVEVYSLNKKLPLFKLPLPFTNTFSKGFLSGDENLILIKSEKEDICVIINIEKQDFLGKFSIETGLDHFYWNSSNNTELVNYELIALDWSKRKRITYGKNY